MRKKAVKIVSMLLTAIFLFGCQQAPNKKAVTSKNDGILQARIDQTLSPEEAGLETGAVPILWNEEFTSTDGSVTFSVDISNDVTPDVKQVVEVVPHRLTEEDIRRVAEVLLGDVYFYERRSSSHPEYSKSQYQKMINRLSAYASRESLTNLMGESDADVYLEYVQLFIENWTKEYETAPENDPRTPCDWSLKKERHYNDSDVEIGNRSVADDSDVLYVNAEKSGIEYNYSVITKAGNGYKVNRLNLNLTEGLGLTPVEMAISRAILCRTAKPTNEQIQAISVKAQDMLEKMNLGQWEIIKKWVETKHIGNALEYTIHVTAVPKFNGTPAIYGQNLRNLQETYAATYFLSEAEFEFSANGEMIYFNLESPVDVVETRNENVATMTATELLEKCKQHLSLSDADAYGLPADIRSEIEAASGEKFLCQVCISEVEYNLGRVKKPDSNDHYYYLPVMAFKGTVEYISEKTGTIYYANSTGQPNETIPILVCMNAVDGSIIQ